MRFSVYVKARSARAFVGGSYGDALVISVQEPAVEGRANEAILRALAEALEIPVRRLRIASGERGKRKIIEVDGDEEDLLIRVSKLKAEA